MLHSNGLHERCGCAGAAGRGAAAAAPFALAGTERQYERSRPFTFASLSLGVTLDPPRRSLTGTAVLGFERVDRDATELELDAVGFVLRAVELDTGAGFKRVHPAYDGERLRVRVPARAARGRLRVAYSATPRKGMYFLAPDADHPDRPEQVWTQCQDEDARHWFPCHDKPHVKLSTELRVTVPSGLRVLSNGDLVSARTPRGRPWTFHYAMREPHSSYLVTLVAGRFDVVDDRAAKLPGARPVPVAYWVPPGQEADARRSLGETPRMIELFGRLTGVPFPWTRYSQVVVSDFVFGGMENTTATTLYEHALLDERAALDVTTHELVAHELAHQWFGDWVTCRDWSHGWLNEGFATFFEHLEREDRLGRDEYDHGVDGDLQSYLSEAGGRYQRPIVCRDYREPIDLFDRHLYEKGSLVLHMLRRELGDSVFWAGVRRYLELHARGIVETADLQRALEHVSGRSLERFFDQWVYRAGHPSLEVRLAWERGQLVARVKQSRSCPEAATFAFLLELELAEKGGRARRVSKLVTDEVDALVVPCAEPPEWVVVDPDLRVATALQLEAPADLLRRQLASAPRAAGRLQAARALARRDDVPTIQALAQALRKRSEAWMVRAEVATALGRIRAEEALVALVAAADADDPRVRRAVAAALGGFPDARAARALEPLLARDPSYLVVSEAARSLGRTRDAGARALLEQHLDHRSWADVTRAGALDGLAELGDEAAVPVVVARTRPGIPTRGRRAAVLALPRLAGGRKVREQLERLLDDPDPHLRTDVVRALLVLGDPRARGALSRRLGVERDARVARRLREALRDLGDSSGAERRRVNDRMVALEAQLAELKARLTKLEAPRARKPAGATRPRSRRRP